MSELATGAVAAPSTVAAAQPAARAAKTDEQREGFERLLLGQLTKELVDSAMPADENASAATASYRQMLPDALTEALMSGGGIGLAQQLAGAEKTSASGKAQA